MLFVPDARKTPALRAGTVDPNDPYQFAMPPTWREGKVANIQSGSYCQVAALRCMAWCVLCKDVKRCTSSFTCLATASLCRTMGRVRVCRRH